MTTPVGTLGTEEDIVDLRQYAAVLYANAVRAPAETGAVRERLLRTQRELRSAPLSLTRAVVVEEPRMPSAPTLRSYVLNLFFGGILALVGGVALAFGLEAIQPLLDAQSSERQPAG